jgi:Flp pilus assembly protein TadD
MNFSSHKLNDWLADRPWRMLWRGLPVLLAVGGALLVIAVALAGHSRRSELRSRYHRSAISALAAKNFEGARVICLRGLSFDSDEQTRLEWLFYLSIALNGLGHEQEAASLLATAAPEDRLGCVQAHVAVAQMLLRSTNITEKAIRSAERQLQNAFALDPRSPEINEMLGRFYINTHQFDAARKRLLEVYPVKKEIALLLAITYSASGDSTAARTWSDTAIEVFGKNLKQVSPADSPADRLGLAQALAIQESCAEALKILEAWPGFGWKRRLRICHRGYLCVVGREDGRRIGRRHGKALPPHSKGDWLRTPTA